MDLYMDLKLPPALLSSHAERKMALRQYNLSSYPTTDTVACKVEAQSEHAHVAPTFSHVWAPTWMLSRCLVTQKKKSASEHSRKFIKGALLVGYVRCYVWNVCAKGAQNVWSGWLADGLNNASAQRRR